MKCILHIGTEKTGTTLLQSWLYSNRQALGEQGVYLSEKLGKPNNRLFSAYFERGLSDWAKRNGISTLEQKDEYFEGFLERLADEIILAAENHQYFLIASEHLHSRIKRVEDVRAIAGFLNEKFDEVKIICYFRNQFDMAVSHYSTALKVSSDVSVEHYVQRAKPDNYYFNFLEIADNWSGVFGRSNCVFKLYDRADFPDGDICKDFLKELLPEISMTDLDFDSGSSNDSLSYLEAAAYRTINRLVPYWDEVNGGVSSLNAQLKAAISQVGSLREGRITSNAREEITDRFEYTNKKFLKKYFSESSGFDSKNHKLEETIAFTIEDVGNIVSGILDRILPINCLPGNLEDKDANCLRDIAVKIERGDTLSIADALTLMELAKRARPDGPFIASKVEEYQNTLSSKP